MVSTHAAAVRPAAPRPARLPGAHRVNRAESLGSRSTALLDHAAGALGARLGGRERILPVGVAVLVLIGSLSGLVSAGPTGAIGGTHAGGSTPRLAVAGLQNVEGGSAAGIGVDGVLGDPGADRLALTADAQSTTDQPEGPFLADGTLLKPIAVTTTVADGADKLQTYRVRSGDTLTGIARHFGISMMTLWWANNLKSKDALHVGERLVIPPVDGTVHVVKEGETLDALAAATGLSASDIVSFNGLTDATVVVGQTLILPGARGKPIATPKPVSHPVARRGGSSSGHVTYPSSYGGGPFAWPVPGGYISQYFHYGHPALDIAAPYGSRIVAAASGTVIWAGWKDNGGGYQVWVAHGSGLYTTYNHMSAITVGVGAHVGRGAQVGRVGQSGWATGPHCHFEVWRGEVWGSGYRVNPLSYL